MGAFAYKAMDGNGRSKSGVMEADTPRQVRQQLREQSLIPMEVTQVSHKDKQQSSGLRLFQRSISSADLALLTRQIATLIESALPIEEALQAVAEQCEKPRHKNMMMAVRSKVVEGHGLADAMGEFPLVFDQLYRAMVAAGEKSGHLDTVLNRLADYTEKRNQTRSQIIQAMIYPALMLTVALLVVIALLTQVVPKIVGQFNTMGQELPVITRVMIAISEWLQNYVLILGVVILVLAVVMQRLLQLPRIKLAWHRMLLRLPMLGKVSRGLNTARFARTLSILTSSAVPLLESMRIAAQVLENLHIRNLILDASERVKEGSSLRAALEKTRMFPPMMMHMIASGERSGELQQMLTRAADNQDREFETLVSVTLKVFEPVLIVSMAAIVMFIVMAILQPILALNSMVNL